MRLGGVYLPPGWGRKREQRRILGVWIGRAIGVAFIAYVGLYVYAEVAGVKWL